MNVPKITNRHLLQLVGTYWQWRWLWIGTTVTFAIIGFVYVLFLKSDQWVASQGLIVRDEANGAVMRLGRFESQAEMRAAQETIFEMSRNTQVVHDALQVVGREPSWCDWFRSSTEPTSSEIDSMAKSSVSVRAPKGAELGTTEVIYLDIKQSTRGRALEMNNAVCDALEKRLKQVRQTRANGVISELLAAKESATVNLQRATQKLQKMEAEAGVDLSDLRGLTDAISNGSTTRIALDAVKQGMLAEELAMQQLKVDLETAKASLEDPDQLLLTPTKLVNAHTGLQRLRDGLSAAGIASSQLQGRYTDAHPKVIASKETEQRIRAQLRDELANSVATLTKEIEVSNERIEKLKQQQASLEERVTKLAQIRASYANVASEVNARNVQLQEAERELAQAEAARDAALTSSLLTRIDQPLIGEKPIGPGRSTILAGTTLGGLFFGFGVVFLLSPIDGGISYGRRRFDYSGKAGRRAADQLQPQVELDRRAETKHGSSGSPTTAGEVQPKPTAAADASDSASLDEAPGLEAVSKQNSPSSIKHDEEQLITISQPAGLDRVSGWSAPVSAAKVVSLSADASSPVNRNSTESAVSDLAPQAEADPPATAAAETANPTLSASSAPAASAPIAKTTQDSIAAAQAVIAAALNCSFSDNAKASPQS